MTTLTESASTALQLLTSLDPTLVSIVARSLSVSACACLLACSVGLALGAWLGVAQFAGRSVVLTLLNTSLAIPSVVVGLLVYLLLSRSGPLGYLGWLFSFKAMVLAQAVLVLPIVTALTRQTVQDAEQLHGEQLRSLGAGPLLPLSSTASDGGVSPSSLRAALAGTSTAASCAGSLCSWACPQLRRMRRLR